MLRLEDLKLQLRFKEWKFAAPAIFVAGVFIFVSFLHLHTPEKVKGEYATHLESKGISITHTYQIAKIGDANNNGKVDAGDKVEFKFVLTNKSNQAARTVSLDTGISQKLIYFIQNIHGSTGISQDTPTVIFRNIVLLPNETQTLSFESLTFKSDKDYQIDIQPVVIDPSNTAVVKGSPKTLAVTHVDNSQLPSQVQITRAGEQQ